MNRRENCFRLALSMVPEALSSRGVIRATLKSKLEIQGAHALVSVEFDEYCGPRFFKNESHLVPVKASHVPRKMQISLSLHGRQQSVNSKVLFEKVTVN